MSNKLVSIIIPAYNVEKYIRQSIFSVLQQTYKEIEIIIVDDGSTDSTGSIIAEYSAKDTRITILTQKNRGLAAARNTGLRHAKGEYLCILDSDDIMLPEKIAKQLEFLEQHPEFDITYSDLYHFIDGTSDVYHHTMGALGDNQYQTLLLGNVINPNAVFFRRSVFEKCGGFDETLRSAEDWEYWLNVAYHKIKFGYQPIPLTLYRMRNNSLSANSVVMMETPIRVLEKQLLLPLGNIEMQIVKTKIEYWKKRLYLAHLRNGKNLRSWVLKLRLWLIKKITFPLRFKKMHNAKVEHYLQQVEQYGKNR